jgi:repressor LexA
MIYTDLTKRQSEVLEYIKQVLHTKGYPPTVREICDAVGLKSPATVHAHLRTLEERGYIKRDSSKQRALEIVGDNVVSFVGNDDLDSQFPNKEMANVPLIGSIAAGQPLYADEQVEDVYPLPLDFLNSNSELFMLRVRGESMIEAGILNGDLIIVEKTPVVRNGEIAAVLLDDSATVKYFYKERGHYRLEPANSTMSSIIAFDVQVLGRVIGLLRRF